MCKVSIIIPVYNVENYILLCLKSVCSQTFSDSLECVIVDDCGTDNSIGLLNDFIEKYNGKVRFSLIHHSTNKGLSAARNTGINSARGKYLFFLDSDDEITENCIECLYNLAEKNCADIVQGSYLSESEYIKNIQKIIHPDFTEDRSYITSSLLDYDRNPVMAQNRLIRRDVIVDHSLYFKEGIIHEDIYWTFFLAKYVTRMCFTKEKTYVYRVTPGSITQKTNIEKESKAFNESIIDFCNNIDIAIRGAQMKYILNNLLRMVNGNFYLSEEKKKHIIDVFFKKNTFCEKFILKTLLLLSPEMYLYSKLHHLLLRLY